VAIRYFPVAPTDGLAAVAVVEDAGIVVVDAAIVVVVDIEDEVGGTVVVAPVHATTTNVTKPT
jgi:hypothetical protein